jgi:hypothetical protein
MNIYFQDMSSSALKAFSVGLVLVICAFGPEQASARSKKHRPVRPPAVPSIMVDETGTPIIMQGLERPKRAIQGRRYTSKQAERRVYIPRGSGTYTPPISSARRSSANALALGAAAGCHSLQPTHNKQSQRAGDAI